jgi:hypothetical protein
LDLQFAICDLRLDERLCDRLDYSWHGHLARETRTRVVRPYSGDSARAQRSAISRHLPKKIADARADSLRDASAYRRHGQDAHATKKALRSRLRHSHLQIANCKLQIPVHAMRVAVA